MTRTGRALLGALLGALITLCIHPDSRPFMIGLMSRISPDMLRDAVDANARTVTVPTSLPQASLWMQLAAARIRNLDRLSPKEVTSLLQIAGAGRKQDHANAFWPQMESILFDESGQPARAIESWIEASRCTKWDDYQIVRLRQARTSLTDITGETKSWQLAFLYYSRSDDVSSCLERLSKHLLQTATYDTPAGLQLRYATLLNGDLVRQYAHSTKTNVSAINIVELAAFPPNLVEIKSPKRLWTGENTIIVNLEKILGQKEYSDRARKIFLNTESWNALTVQDSNSSDAAMFSMLSVVSSTVASAAVVIAALGTLIWLLSKLVEWRLAQSKEIHWSFAVAVAITLGGLAFLLTQYLPAAFAVSLCAAFLTVAPNKSRKIQPSDLGPLLTLVAVLLGLICSALLATYLVGSTPAAVVVLPRVGVPTDYVDKPILAGLSLITFGLVFLMSPFWALAQRVGTPHVLAMMLGKFGAFVAVMGLTLSVILGPLSVYADHLLEHTLFQMLTNEPFHYYLMQ